ncbi:MAG: magnesium-translocating P-type ATPase [Polyangia bacterium]
MRTMVEAAPISAGLTTAEATARLAEVGPNDPAPRRGRSRLVELLVLFGNPLVVILLVAGVTSAVLGEHVNAALIIAMVALSVIVNFVQTFRSQRAVERLRAGVAPTATVLRDGAFRELPRREVVPGDVVQLGAGDLVPADAKLLQARDLHVHEASLTGESMPVEKEAGAEVCLGTSVVSGNATALVTATGARTQFGEIAARLVAHPPETEFERGLRRFGGLIMRAVFFLVLFIVVVNLALHRPPFESLLFAVALAVGLTPEFLPMITAVTLTQGAVRMARQKVIVKHLAAIQNFGSIDILCSDKTGTLTAGEMAFDRSLDALGAPSNEPLRLAYLTSRFETGIKSPLDKAILGCAGLDGAGYEKRDELPFDFERRRSSVVVERAGVLTLVCKGAPEGILAVAVACEAGGAVVPLDDAMRARCRAAFDELCTQGLRVLAVAHRTLAPAAAWTAADERELTLAGFVAFADPPLDDARDAIAALARDGVAVKILTGDNELVARHVCAQVGLDVSEIVLGRDLERMGDTALAHVAERATVFARVSPAQTNRILLALKQRSHVVGYMGDGINDAPSLHAADVGISVPHAVDVARDAADIILLAPGLRVLHQGILEGRKAFGNVMKYLLMGTSSNFGNMFSMAGASLFLPFLPMLPTQILLNNFLYDLAQVTIPTDRVDDEYIRTPQRWNIKVIRNFMLIIGPLSSIYDFVTFFVLLRMFHASERAFHTGWFVESLATQTLVLFVIRTAGNPLRSRPSVPLTVTTLVIVALGAALPFTPLAHLLGFEPLPASFFGFLAGVTLTYLVLVEVVKRRLLRRH